MLWKVLECINYFIFYHYS